jgi:hypothetical protein
MFLFILVLCRMVKRFLIHALKSAARMSSRPPLCLEQLEPRVVPAPAPPTNIFHWMGGNAANAYDIVANWDQIRLPGPLDTVVLDGAKTKNDMVLPASGKVTVASLEILNSYKGSVKLNMGILTVTSLLEDDGGVIDGTGGGRLLISDPAHKGATVNWGRGKLSNLTFTIGETALSGPGAEEYTVNWSTGSVEDSTVIFLPDTTVNVRPSKDKEPDPRSVLSSAMTNFGTFNLNADLTLDATSVFWNLGLFNVYDADVVTRLPAPPNATFINAGLFVLPLDPSRINRSSVKVNFVNTAFGYVGVSNGILSFGGSGTQAGRFFADATSHIVFRDSGANELARGVALTGIGFYEVQFGATLTIDTGVNVQVSHFVLGDRRGEGATLTIHGQLQVAYFDWNAGLINGDGLMVVQKDGVLKIVYTTFAGLPARLGLDGSVLVYNYGFINWQKGNVVLDGSAAIVNDGSKGQGIFNVNTSGTISTVKPGVILPSCY